MIYHKTQNSKERGLKQFDAVTCSNPLVVVHEAKFKVDGITKYLENFQFRFDHTFDEDSSTETVYEKTAKPLVDFVLNEGGCATCFAYGQVSAFYYWLFVYEHMHTVHIFFPLFTRMLDWKWEDIHDVSNPSFSECGYIQEVTTP